MIEKIVWSQKTIKINDLKDYDKNPRKISKDAFDRLVRDIQEDGYHSRIKANTDYTIIGGHARKKALLKAGYKSTDDIQVLIPDRTLSDEEFKRINIKDNLIFGDFDFDILANEFNQDDLIEWGMPADWLNVESQELNAGLTDDDAVPGLAEDAITVLGDVWVLGDHRLMCGDSTSIDSIEKLMQGNKVDMLFTDPPYNVGFNGRSGKFSIIENDNLPDNEFTSFIEEVCQTIKTINPNIYYIWCNWKFYGILQSQLTFKACIVWAKNVFGLGQGYRHQHEFCLFNGKVDDTIKDESDLWEIAKDSKYIHPTQKPVALAERALCNHRDAKHILDLFGGSGSTLIACEKSNRKCYMMELDPKYCDVIIKRWQEFTGQKAILEASGDTFEQLNRKRA